MLQVGTIGLIKAIDQFDLSREVEFTTFAIPYITGEIKRFFRDTSWAVHVPRRLQELRLELAKATEELATRLDRAPTTAELAELLGLTTEEVIEGLVASNGYTAGSLEMTTAEDDDHNGRPVDRLGDLDPALQGVENLHVLKPLMAQLGERDLRILQMRFGDEMTQAQIGVELGISQMHVSRLLTKVLDRLRQGMLAEATT
ncbi:SigB/SigF/SigG family RNA polymerase sigma factor [Streptomyces sp. So13.3]|nr:SigB/SigF/SigG family RNA polymerase sigma factor [Streptomyces sp. So13.3]